MNLRHISDELFAAVGSPRRLEAERVRLNAWLTINAAAAQAGRPQPGGDALIAVGTEREVEVALALAVAKASPAGGLFVVEFSPAGDGVRVAPLAAVEARGRAALAAARPDPDGWYPVEIGERAHCERDATRLRRIRAGCRSQEVPAI